MTELHENGSPSHGGWRRLANSRNRSIAIGAASAILIAGAIWIWASSRDSGDKPALTARGGSTTASSMAGMDMNDDGSVQLRTDQVRQFGITFGMVEDRVLTTALRATATVTTAETGVTRVTPKVNGYVERLYVDFTGAVVRRGQPLVELYSPDVLAAQEELLLARRVDGAVGQQTIPGVPSASADLLGAARRRLRLLDVSDAEIDEVLRTGRANRTMTIVAPTSGTVMEKFVVEGQAIAAGSPLFTLADLSRVWLDIEVREGEAGSLRTGLGVDIEVTALPGRSFKGRVEFIQPTIDPVTRTGRARIGVSNTEGMLKPGMYATATLLIPSRRALTVPASAVINTGERALVFVDMGSGRLMPHDIEIGESAGEFVEVLAGLEPGQRVVTSAQFLLESESNIGEVMRAMMGQTGSADMKMDMPPTRDSRTKTPPPAGR
ncbi:MAG: efflux RND transporter periplasmic adaptor subunit [Gemmatimonadaceae bacterium]